MSKPASLNYSNIGTIFTYLASFLVLFLFPITWESWIPRVRYTGLILLCSVGIVWLVLKIKYAQVWRVPKSVIPLIAYIGIIIFSVFNSPLSQYSFDFVIYDVVLLFVFLFYIDSFYIGWSVKTWENALITLAVVSSILEGVGAYSWYQQWWHITGDPLSFPPKSYRVSGLLFSHPNIVAGFLNLSIFMIVVRLIYSDRTIVRVYWGVLLSLVGMIEYFTSSRSGWLGLMVGLVVMLLLVNYKYFQVRLKKPEISFLLKIKKHQLIATGFFTLVFLFIVFIASQQVQRVDHGTLADRLGIWSYSWELVISSPIFGHGGGVYPFLNALRSNQIIDSNIYYHAHNFFLQIGVESGVVGLLLIFWFIYWVMKDVYSSWQLNRNEISKNTRMVAYICGIIAVMVQHTLDYQFNQVMFALSVLLVFALVLQGSESNQIIEVKSQQMIYPILGLLGVISAGVAFSMRGASEYTQGLMNAGIMNWKSSSDQICQASDINIFNSLYDFQCGFASGMVAYEYNDSAALDTAIRHYKSGLSRDPFWYLNWANLASLEWESGNELDALTHMRKAVNNSPRDVLLLVNLGWMEEELGNDQEALDAYSTAFEINPWLMNDGYFTRTELRKAAQIEKPDNDYWNGWEALNQGDLEMAEYWYMHALERSPENPAPYAYLALTKQRAGLYAEAWRYVQKSNFLNHDSFTPYLIVSEVALEQSKFEEANNLLTRAFNLVEFNLTYQRYYNSAYHRPYLAYSLSPFMLRVGFTPMMRKNFAALDDYLSNQGEDSGTQMVLNWIRNSEDK